MDAIVTAGGIPEPGEPLYEYTLGKSKALLDINGKPMIQWVLNALQAAQTIDKIVIVGLPEDSSLVCDKLIGYLPTQGGMVENIRISVIKLLEINPAARKMLVASSDIPAITAEMVNWVVNETSKDDLQAYYNVITRQTMETRFPGSNRTYTHLKDMDVCGGDMNVIHSSMVTSNTDIWEKIVASRKNPIKQASMIGIDTLILLLLRRITLKSAVKRITTRLHITGRELICPYAEVGMDVDKPHQLEIVRADMAKHIPV